MRVKIEFQDENQEKIEVIEVKTDTLEEAEELAYNYAKENEAKYYACIIQKG